MIDTVALFLEGTAARFADVWLTYWQRHGADDVYARPHWC